MFEKVNPSHPDKVADRIAGAVVDLAYSKNDNPKCAVEVLLGHGVCTVIAETSEDIKTHEVETIVERIAGKQTLHCIIVPQDPHLAGNQEGRLRCGDNGIFKGVPLTKEQTDLSRITRELYEKWPYDGKYVLAGKSLIACQSNAKAKDIEDFIREAHPGILPIANPIGDWTGGPMVDSGATNRKLGSDMGDSVTGGGLHGKDLSKADVSVNIWCWLKAQETGKEVKACCAIGDMWVHGVSYEEIVETAREFIRKLGGFEKFAEWGLF